MRMTHDKFKATRYYANRKYTNWKIRKNNHQNNDTNRPEMSIEYNFRSNNTDNADRSVIDCSEGMSLPNNESRVLELGLNFAVTDTSLDRYQLTKAIRLATNKIFMGIKDNKIRKQCQNNFGS
ncbi:hypothetical protein GJ496_010695 [Pomphorhynchus laevis]|nr:hypothetical protein GJ496_010695 [Pomphorhynchus laevis]